MGFGKKWKKAFGAVLKAIPGGETIAQGTSLAGIADSSVDRVNRQETATKNAMATAEQQAQQTGALNAQIAEQTRLKLLSEADLKAQEEALKKRTTFAGSSLQGVMERKKLLGI
jgi:hypothetical protein